MRADGAPEGDLALRWVAALRVMTIVALVATVLGRAVAPALRGAAAGIEHWIRWADFGGAAFGQLLAFVGTAATVSLLLGTLRSPRLGLAYRLFVVPASAGATTLVMMSAAYPLDFQATVLMSAAAGMVPLVATGAAVARPETRALGLLLAGAGAAGVVWVAARVLALKASSDALPSLFVAARGVATGALVLDLLLAALAAGWILGARRGALAWGLGLVVVAGLAAWSSAGASAYGTSLWRVILARSLAELSRGPAPLLVPEIVTFVDALSLALAAASTVARRPLGAAAGLVMAARGGTDVPLSALCLVAASLATLAAGGRAPGPRAGDSPTEARRSGH